MKPLLDAQALMSALLLQDAKGAPQNNMMNLLTLIIVIFFAFYFLILRPQKREQDKRKQQLESLGKGDKVITIGGIHGTVVEIDHEGDTMVLQVDKNTKISFARSAVSKIIRKKSGSEQSSETDTSGNK